MGQSGILQNCCLTFMQREKLLKYKGSGVKKNLKKSLILQVFCQCYACSSHGSWVFAELMMPGERRRGEKEVEISGCTSVLAGKPDGGPRSVKT